MGLQLCINAETPSEFKTILQGLFNLTHTVDKAPLPAPALADKRTPGRPRRVNVELDGAPVLPLSTPVTPPDVLAALSGLPETPEIGDDPMEVEVPTQVVSESYELPSEPTALHTVIRKLVVLEGGAWLRDGLAARKVAKISELTAEKAVDMVNTANPDNVRGALGALKL